MSVYNYDAVRTTRKGAIDIIKSIQKNDDYSYTLSDDCLDCISLQDDGSVYLEWTTWHGSPMFEIELPDEPILWHNINNDLEYDVEEYGKIPDSWRDGYHVITDEDGSQRLMWDKFGKGISIDELLKE